MRFHEKLFLDLPLPLSKWVFSLSRALVYKDVRAEGFEQAVKYVKDHNVKGDYLEFGVNRGSSFIAFYHLFEKFGITGHRYFAFDSFQGLPESEGAAFTKGEFEFPEKLFLKRIKKAGVDLGRLGIIKGFYNQSLTEAAKKTHQLNKASIIHVDCDLYVSTVDVLRFCESLVQEGTVLIFDDYYSFAGEENPENFGEEKAFKEWKLFPQFEQLYHYKTHPSVAFVCKKR